MLVTGGRDKASLPRQRPLALAQAELDADAVRRAYRRWARIYDVVFGPVSSMARRRAVAAANRLPGRRVLEVGVGTGLALRHYSQEKRVVGIDLSSEMLARAQRRLARTPLPTVESVMKMDAEAMRFADGSFDIAVAMFVASVVPHPRRLLSEMQRVVRPGGHLLFMNHFAAAAGPRWWIERAMVPASRELGWHPDFALEALLPPRERAGARCTAAPPLQIFTLVELDN